MENTHLAEGDSSENEVKINLHMLRPLVLDGVRREIYRTDVVTIDKGGLGRWLMEFLKELAKPRCFGDAVCDGAIFGFGARTRYCGLTFGRPGDHVLPKINTKPGSGSPCVGKTGPVSIRVGNKIQRGVFV